MYKIYIKCKIISQSESSLLFVHVKSFFINVNMKMGALQGEARRLKFFGLLF